MLMNFCLMLCSLSVLMCLIVMCLVNECCVRMVRLKLMYVRCVLLDVGVVLLCVIGCVV